jgi:hypothetical protein
MARSFSETANQPNPGRSRPHSLGPMAESGPEQGGLGPLGQQSLGQLAGRGTEQRTPTRMVIFWLEKFHLENYDVS